MADTKITQLRNLMTPLVNYFTMLSSKECSDKAVRLIEHDKKQSIINLPKIREILAQIPDDACEGETSNDASALPIPDVSGLLPFDEAALKREYNLETYGKMTDWDRKQLWTWFVGKLKGNNR